MATIGAHSTATISIASVVSARGSNIMATRSIMTASSIRTTSTASIMTTSIKLATIRAMACAGVPEARVGAAVDAATALRSAGADQRESNARREEKKGPIHTQFKLGRSTSWHGASLSGGRAEAAISATSWSTVSATPQLGRFGAKDAIGGARRDPAGDDLRQAGQRERC